MVGALRDPVTIRSMSAIELRQRSVLNGISPKPQKPLVVSAEAASQRPAEGQPQGTVCEELRRLGGLGTGRSNMRESSESPHEQKEARCVPTLAHRSPTGLRNSARKTAESTSLAAGPAGSSAIAAWIPSSAHRAIHRRAKPVHGVPNIVLSVTNGLHSFQGIVRPAVVVVAS